MADESDLPSGTAESTPSGKSEDELIGDISNLLDDPDMDLEEEDQDQAKAAKVESDEDDPDAEDVAEQDDAEDDDGPQDEIKGGRFAPDSAKVTLEDGTVITVAELKRNNLFQRDYTRKRQEEAEAAKAVAAKDAELSQYAQSLNQSRDYLAWFAETHMPKRPDAFAGNPMADPAGYLEWQHKENQWRALNEAYQTFQQQKEADAQRHSGETQKEAQERLKREADALSEAFPVLRNPDKRRGFWERLETGANQFFGISAEEVRSIGDHRMVKVLHAAVRQMRLEQKAPQVREEVKRPVPKSNKRVDTRAQGERQRQAQTERLRRDGTLEAGISVLESFDL
jgi:hypothetical protein